MKKRNIRVKLRGLNRTIDWQIAGKRGQLKKLADGPAKDAFNVGGNEFRLVCAVHINTGMVFALRFLSHAEYSKNSWQNEL